MKRIGITTVSLACNECGAPIVRMAAEVARQRRRQNRDDIKSFCSHECQQKGKENAWTQSDDDFLRRNFETMTHREMAERLSRTKVAVDLRTCKLGLKKVSQMDQREVTFIINNVRKLRVTEIANKLGRHRSVVGHFMQKLGIGNRRQKVTQSTEAEIEILHSQGFNDVEIANSTGYSKSVVRKWRIERVLKPNGYTERSRARISEGCFRYHENLRQTRQEKCPIANAEIVLEDYDRLVCHIAIKWGADKRAVKDSWQYADGWVGLVKARDAFDTEDERATFATFAFRCIENQIWNTKNMQKTQKRGAGKAPHLFSELESDQSNRKGEDLAVATAEPVKPNEQASNLLSILDERSRRLVTLVLMKDATLEAAAATESPPISKERVRQIIERAVSKMKEESGVA